MKNIPHFPSLTFDQLLTQIASTQPVPGGGAVAAASAQMGVGLVVMAIEVSLARHPENEHLRDMPLLGKKLMQQLGELAQADMVAFDSYMQALRRPKDTEEEKQQRKAALAEATQSAIEVPLTTAQSLIEGLLLAQNAVDHVVAHIVSDVGAGAALLYGALQATLLTVDINLPGQKDEKERANYLASRNHLALQGRQLHDEVLQATHKNLQG